MAWGMGYASAARQTLASLRLLSKNSCAPLASCRSLHCAGRAWIALFAAVALAVPAQDAFAAKRKKAKPSQAITAPAASKTARSNGAKTKKTATSAPLSPVHDAELMAIYSALAEGKLSQALAQADALVLKAPSFSLGHLLRADILNAKANRPAPSIAAQTQASLLGASAAARRMTELRAEAHLRLLALQHPPQAAELPSNLISIAPDVPRVVVVDALRSRLYVYENSAQGLYLSHSLYMTQGRLGANKVIEGDQKTPIGVYFSDGAIEKKLPDLYGYGALNTDYPNVWDKRQNRTGHGIWLHGTPKESYARAPYASDGCVVLANPDIATIFPLVSPKVPVVLAENVRFVPAAQLAKLRAEMNTKLDAWVANLAQPQSAAMTGFYASDFAPDVSLQDETKNGQTVLAAWLARKAALATAQSGAAPKMVGLTAITYPNEPDLMHTRFELHYPPLANTNAKANASPKNAKAIKTSQNTEGGLVLRKTIYWKKTDGQWLITLETAGQTGAL
jgi:lipoprotein-anchoring transpeptidase ErfK/SrfK